MREINRIVFHHSASPRSTTAASIHHYHTSVKGWSDTGYHFVIEAEGEIVPARPLDMVGAHARGHNNDSIGVCIVGDNTVAGRRWSHAQIAAGGNLLDALCLIFPGVEYLGHRDLGAATLCPGCDVRDFWGD